jgi:hypothetical protein
MSFARSLFIIAAASVLAGCGPNSAPPALQYATLTGRVLDASTNQPIAGAVVTVDLNLASAPTGANGVYTVGNLPSGPVEYSVTAGPSYASTQGELTLTSNQTYHQDFLLNHT